MIAVGTTVRDSITGLVGVATCRTEYMDGTASLFVEPQGLHDGRPIKGAWIIEARLSQESEADK